MTSYMVLTRNKDQTGWTERGFHDGNSQREAKLKAIGDEEPEDLEIVAVPTRSWDPEPVWSEKQTKLRFGERA